jgi:hypothetical protein
MAIAKGYAATDASKPLTPFTFERREPNDDDVVISVKYLRALPFGHSPGPQRMGQLEIPDGPRP